jgi:hypothetical protein
MTVNKIILEYGKDMRNKKSIEILENLSKFPYNLLLDRNYIQIFIEFHYKEKINGYEQSSFVSITKHIINNS